MHQLVVTNPAIADLEKARDWYNKQQPNLGTKYINYIFRCFDQINVGPLTYPSKYKNTRELVVKRYPYLIIFSVEEDFIFVLRVFPCKTNPKGKYKK